MNPTAPLDSAACRAEHHDLCELKGCGCSCGHRARRLSMLCRIDEHDECTPAHGCECVCHA